MTILNKIFLLIALFIPTLTTATTPTILDKIVAVVNEDVITQQQLNNRLIIIKRQLIDANTPVPSTAVLRKQVLEHIINETLQLQVAKNIGISIDDKALDQATQNIAKQNGMTLSQFSKAVQKNNYTYAQFRDDLRNEMTINRVQQQQVTNQISISEREIDNLTLPQQHKNSAIKYKIGHILLSLPENPSSAQVEKSYIQAQQLLQDLNSGANFQELAVTYSKGPQALKGGNLGWRKANEVPTLFTDLVATMEKGEYAGPIRSAGGLHIITLLDKKQQTSGNTKDQERTEARQTLQNSKYQEQYSAWLIKLHDESHIEIRL